MPPRHDLATGDGEPDWRPFDKMLEEAENDKIDSYRNNLDYILIFVSSASNGFFPVD